MILHLRRSSGTVKSVFAMLWITAACVLMVYGGPPPSHGAEPRPSVSALTRRPPSIVPGMLPAGAKAQFPEYDGDGSFVTLPPHPALAVSAIEVRYIVIAPVLKALGFSGTVSDLLLPVAAGVPMLVASVRGLTEAALTHYEKTSERFRAQTQ